MKRATGEKENTPKRKVPRKSVGHKRVSFGAVSMHEYEKTMASPTPADSSMRRTSLAAAGAAAREAEAGMASGQIPGTPPPPQPPPPPAEQLRRSPRGLRVQEARAPLSPSASEVSEAEVFFSPTESVPESPAAAARPRLSTLLREDEGLDGGAPALSELLEQDEANETMDVTMMAGGIRSLAAVAEADEVPDSAPAAAPPTPQLGLSPVLSEAGEEEAEMDMTVAVGSIQPQPVQPSSASSRRSSTGSASSRRSSLSEEAGVAGEPPLKPPPEAVERRRFSLGGVLATVSSKLAKLATSTLQSDEQSEAKSPAPPPPPPPPAEAQEEAEAEKAAATADAPAAQGAVTFDAYLQQAGVHFTIEQRRASSVGGGCRAPGLQSGEAASTLTAHILTTCVFQPKLEQLRWAAQELRKCAGSLRDDFVKMSSWVGQESPKFFTEPPVSLIPAQQIKKLKARCRQAARSFWYDWRAKLESASSRSLSGAMAGLDKDLGACLQQAEELEQLRTRLASSVETAESQVGALSEQSRSAQHQLAQREPALRSAQQRRAALQAELMAAEAEFARLESMQSTQQARLQEQTSVLAALRAPSAASERATLHGDDLLEALQAATCWRPAALGSSALVLAFGEHFELTVGLDPQRGAVTSIELHSRLRPAAAVAAAAPAAAAAAAAEAAGAPGAAPHLALLGALFPSVHAELRPLLAACSSARQLPALLHACSLRLGRLLELSREVQALARRLPVHVAALPVGGGACVTMHFSFFQTRAKFALALALHSEDPQQPLTFSCRPWEGAPGASAAAAAEAVATMLDADVLQRMVSDACAPHACGFGRLGAIVGAVDRSFHPVAPAAALE